MKKHIFSIIAVFFISLTTTAQVDRTKQPKPGPAPTINLGTPKSFTLKNGLRVMIVENHKLPTVSATLLIDNPPKSYGNKKGVETFVGGMLGTGSKTISKEKFDKEVDYLGASISFGNSNASANSLSKYFSRVLELLADAAINPVFNQEEFDKQMKQAVTGIKNSQKSVTTIARRVETALSYGKDHPSGEFTTEETLKNVKLQDVKDLYNTYFKPNNAYLVIIGDVNFKEVKKKISSLFNVWKKGEIPSANLPVIKNLDHTEINFVDMPNAVQSEISVINTVKLNLTDKDYFSALLANYILGGGGTARLYKNLREDKGYTYGAYSGIGNSRYDTRFRATAAVRNTVTDSAVVEMLKEIKIIRFQPVTAEELKTAKASYTGSFVRALERSSTIANYALNIERLGLDKDFYKNYLKNLNAVTIQDVQNAAYKYFKGNKARVVITGKGVDVLKNLENLKYKITYYDKNANVTTKPKMDLPIPAGLTAAKVVENYFNAIGGKDKVSTIKSVLTSSDATVQGMAINLTTKVNASNKSSMVVSANGQTLMKQVFDGAKGYMEQQGRRMDLAGEQLKEAKKNAVIFNDNTYKAGKLDRIANLDGKPSYVIVNGNKEVYYDVKSGLKVREVTTVKAGGKEIKNPVNYSDYKTVNGVKFPHKLSMKMGPMTMNFTVKEIKVNKDITDADFK